MTMEKTIKDFKSLSNFVGFLALMQALTLLNAFSALNKMDITALGSLDYASMGIPASTALTIVKVMSIVPMVLGILILFYLCIKGRREAADPSPAKLHIVLAVICAVVYGLSAATTLLDLFNNSSDLFLKILEVVISGFSSVLMFYYFQYAKKIRTKE